MTKSYQLDISLSLRHLKPFFDNVLLDHGGLPHVLPPAVHLNIFPCSACKFIISHFYSLSFLIRGLLRALGVLAWYCGLLDFRDSLSPRTFLVVGL